jgi:hypothetical protein
MVEGLNETPVWLDSSKMTLETLMDVTAWSRLSINSLD